MKPNPAAGSSYSASFSSPLANILFDTPADPDREPDEMRIVKRFEAWLAGASKKQLWHMAMYIDESIVELLSGKNRLYIARLIEDRAPAIITQMRRLRAHKEHLERTAEMAEILSPASLDKLITAVKHAGDTKPSSQE